MSEFHILKIGGLLRKPQINKWNSEHAQKPLNIKVICKKCHFALAWWFLTQRVFEFVKD